MSLSSVSRATASKAGWARAELEVLAGTLKIQKLSDWYKVSSQSVKNAGGTSVMRRFRDSVRGACMSGFDSVYSSISVFKHAKFWQFSQF
jgi:hypothetical protein